MLVYCEALPMKIILKVPTTFAFLYKTHLLKSREFFLPAINYVGTGSDNEARGVNLGPSINF